MDAINAPTVWIAEIRRVTAELLSTFTRYRGDCRSKWRTQFLMHPHLFNPLIYEDGQGSLPLYWNFRACRCIHLSFFGDENFECRSLLPNVAKVVEIVKTEQELWLGSFWRKSGEAHFDNIRNGSRACRNYLLHFLDYSRHMYAYNCRLRRTLNKVGQFWINLLWGLSQAHVFWRN